VTSSSPSKSTDLAALDRLTGGAFSAATAGERASRIREWLLTHPSVEQLTEVFKDLSVKDKGAAKLVREKLDEIRRAKGQESLSAEWAAKAQTLIETPKLNIADALAWQRDAAKAGAPLSKEPLLTLKTQLAERIRGIEDLQHQVQVQREAAVLLAQRIEVLSTKPMGDAQAALEALRTDVGHWQEQAQSLVSSINWGSVDTRFPVLLDASQGQLLVVWDAFQGALGLALVAAQDAAAPLPPVPVWADEIRQLRGIEQEAPPKAAKPKVDPELRTKAQEAVKSALATLETEVGDGHGKATAGAAAALRNALKEFGKLIDSKLENQAHAALAAAGELEGWQRWRADQLREELVAKAEGLLKRPEGQAIGGRKMQESLRSLRDQWKQTDQGGVPNHALWKRFDEACNEAYKVVEAWLERVKAESAEHRSQRLALIEELKGWAAANRTALDDDWKGFNRVLHQFSDRWRDAGHVGEKVFAELQSLWKGAFAEASAPLEAIQSQSIAARQAMIEEAKQLGAAPLLRIDAVKALQQRWQAQAHAVPIDRRLEQKLWDAFRKPIDEAFNRKSAEREKAEAALGVRDRVVMEAAKALEAANASGDAQAIRGAMAALEAALHGQAQARADVEATSGNEKAGQGVRFEGNDAPAAAATVDSATESIAKAPGTDSDEAAAPAEQSDPAPEPAAAPKPLAKPVVAVRGDDRPGMKKETPVDPRAGKWGDRKDAGRVGRDARDGRDSRRDERNGFAGARQGVDDRGRAAAYQAPRLGDAAFRAQRDAMENAQQALKKLAAQAHGEALVQLLSAWEKRDVALVPSAQELGGRAAGQARAHWSKAVASAPSINNETAAVHLLRLEMAAEVPTPAEHLEARRSLQLQLLTRRHDPAPAQTWADDAAKVFSSAYEPASARRVQAVLKVLLKR
jgi:ATP-dependent RNA helicase SUPV3L1/SUV3